MDLREQVVHDEEEACPYREGPSGLRMPLRRWQFVHSVPKKWTNRWPVATDGWVECCIKPRVQPASLVSPSGFLSTIFACQNLSDGFAQEPRRSSGGGARNLFRGTFGPIQPTQDGAWIVQKRTP